MEELDDLLNELYQLKRIGIKLGLERIRKLLDRLGNPQDKYKVIHVGGTNGKGSVCRIVSSILLEGGYSVGLYTSPHLVHLRERFVINGEEVKDDELLDVLKVVLDHAKRLDEKPTFFEISTATAFELFRRKEVEFAVVEVGMGGRYDAT
ncbi:MAG: bifunctional folylpolyglutamate synthase/dihydrofolate synthase, partial [Thermoplasmata archaeon]